MGVLSANYWGPGCSSYYSIASVNILWVSNVWWFACTIQIVANPKITFSQHLGNVPQDVLLWLRCSSRCLNMQDSCVSFQCIQLTRMGMIQGGLDVCLSTAGLSKHPEAFLSMLPRCGMNVTVVLLLEKRTYMHTSSYIGTPHRIFWYLYGSPRSQSCGLCVLMSLLGGLVRRIKESTHKLQCWGSPKD